MRTLLKSWIVKAAALLFVASTAFAQDRVPFRQAELDQMLAPVALYPDSLLSQMLMASTYPLEVVQAARWSRANPGLKGQEAVNAVERMDWDPSVKSLTAFPQVLARMDENLEWTERLGEAFLAQQEDVMNTVQGLRRRAEAAGNLRSSDQIRVVRQDEAIVIESPAPQVVYVPYYNPVVVYGSWWWPAYPPIYWGPPPGYYAVPAYAPGFYWGSGIVISAGLFFGHFDWPHRHVKVTHVHHYHGRPVHAHTNWRHDPAHRRGVPFRNADAHRRFEQSRVVESRRDSDRGEQEQVAPRVDRFRTSEARQRNLEERRSAASRDRQTVDRAGRGGIQQNRLTTEQTGAHAGLAADRGVSRPAPVTGIRSSRPEASSADSGPRAVRPTPLSAGERNASRPQARNSEHGRSASTLPARANSPAARTESRPAIAPAPRREAAPQRATEPSRRANAQNGNHSARAMPQQRFSAREQSPVPRASAVPAPRAGAAPAQRTNPQPRSAERGTRSADRDNGRRS